MAKKEEGGSIFDSVNKFFGLQSGSARRKRMDDAISDAEKGTKSKGGTLGNPSPKKKKK